MKVLFVMSGNHFKAGSPIIKNQGASLADLGVQIDYYAIIGKGFSGYFKNLSSLYRKIKKNNYDLIHAHYSFSGIMTSIVTKKPLVTSLMGSDIEGSLPLRLLIKWFSHRFWRRTLVKSDRMKKENGLKDAIVVPNGVNIEKFVPMNQVDAREKVNFRHDKKYIIFVVGSTARKEKNYELVKAVHRELIRQYSDLVELVVVTKTDNDLIPYYMNAADVLLLTSLREGSPNVIKEAMACNLPIVSTDVGDVKKVIDNTNNCFILSYNPLEIAAQIRFIFETKKRSNGRDNLIKQGLDHVSAAKKIISLYEEIIRESKK